MSIAEILQRQSACLCIFLSMSISIRVFTCLSASIYFSLLVCQLICHFKDISACVLICLCACACFFYPQTFTVVFLMYPPAYSLLSTCNSHSTSPNCFSPLSSNIFLYLPFSLSFQLPTSPPLSLSRCLQAASNLINNNTMVVCHLLSQ